MSPLAPLLALAIAAAAAEPAQSAPMTPPPVDLTELDAVASVAQPPAPATAPPEIAAKPGPVKARPHFVFANHYGVTMGLEEIPSGDIALFFGRALPALAPSRTHRRWALGYQFTVSIGAADRYFLSGHTHRHHLMAVSYGALRPRLYAALGGGMAIFAGWLLPSKPSGWRPSVAEVEGRLGYIFGRRHTRRLVGVVGGTARVGWNAASLARAPVPQLGAFIGFVVR